MLGQFAQGGVRMRDRLTNRAGFDRVLMTVAATFLTVSATSALAQAVPPPSIAAELAIDAAIPRPEPANLPPPTIGDFKLDATASVPDVPKTDAPNANEPKTMAKPAETKPADLVTAPTADTIKNGSKNDTGKSDTTPTTAPPPDAVTATPAP